MTGTRAERDLRDELVARGYIVTRAAGSLGFCDLLAFRHDRAFAIEVKETGATLASGQPVLRLTDAGGRGLDQRDLLLSIGRAHRVIETCFVVRRKGRTAGHRFAVFPARDLEGVTVLRFDAGVPFDQFFS